MSGAIFQSSVSVTPLRFSSRGIITQSGSLRSCGGRPTRRNKSPSSLAAARQKPPDASIC
jgi:hypothetical protein